MIGYPWLDARTYLEARWGGTVGRVAVDGGFSCPNRGPDRSATGCAFCSGEGSRAPYRAEISGMSEQIRTSKEFLHNRYGASMFSLYFQSYSSTWAPVDTLRTVYDQALADGPFVDLTVGTRPDCLPDPVVDLLLSYRTPGRDVWVELGLQSGRDETLKRIGRGHDGQAFKSAASRLRARGIPFTTHVMFGLPGEGKEEFLDTVALAVAEGSSGLKLHDLLLLPGTGLYREWEQGRLRPVVPDVYLDAVASALVDLPPEMVVWRVCSDPEDRKGERPPGIKWPKNRFLLRLAEEVRARRRSGSGDSTVHR